MSRPTKDEYFLKIAEVVATRSTCLRRAVGCVLVDERGHILATGYNGGAAGMPHCNEEVDVGAPEMRWGEAATQYGPKIIHLHACAGAESPSGTDLDRCQAIHAEQNALVQCRDAQAIVSCYTTCAPCVSCTKLLLGTGCRRIIFREAYANAGMALWLSAERTAGTNEKSWCHHRDEYRWEEHFRLG